MTSHDPVVAALSPPPRLGAAVNVLVVATDDRGDVEGVVGPFGHLSGARADAVELVRIGPGSIDVLHVPRDLRVRSAERGVEALATTLATGGPAAVVASVRDALGVPVHHYVEIGFAGIAATVDELGGVEVTTTSAVRDPRAGLALPAGHHRLDGATAVAYLRARALEERRADGWHLVADDDLARIRRRQVLLSSVLGEALHEPSRMRTAVATARRNVRPDASVTAWTFLRLGWGLGSLSSDDVGWFTLPVEPDDRRDLVSPFPPRHVGGRAWLELDHAAARPLLARMRGG